MNHTKIIRNEKAEKRPLHDIPNISQSSFIGYSIDLNSHIIY